MNSSAKIFVFRLIAVMLVIGISIGFGFAFDAVCTSIEKRQNPMPEAYAGHISTYSQQYGVPEHILYAVIKVESDFDSAKVADDGSIGLMQISPELFEWLSHDLLGEGLESGMLYSPEVNIKYGAYYLSHLYEIYGIWDTCFAAYAKDVATVDSWHRDEKNVDPNGILTSIPDAAVAEYVEKVNEAIDNYTRLYFSFTK